MCVHVDLTQFRPAVKRRGVSLADATVYVLGAGREGDPRVPLSHPGRFVYLHDSGFGVYLT
jgi:hypothetical protein